MRRSPFVLLLCFLGCSPVSSEYDPCDYDNDCDKGRVCRDSYCVRECYVDNDCAEDSGITYICSNHRCMIPATDLQDQDAVAQDDDAALQDQDAATASADAAPQP